MCFATVYRLINKNGKPDEGEFLKSPDFDYACPTTVSDAIALLDEPGIDAMPLAGGQSLVPMMNFRLARPDRLVDLGRIPGLVGVREDGDVLRIGAMTSYAALLSDPLVQAHLPVLSAVLPHVAHPAIRSRGTVGGSLALADPAAEMPAVLLALNGTIVATGPEGTREIAADDYLLGLYETALTPGDLITEVILPKQGPDARYAFYELARRHGDYAMAGAVIVAGPMVISPRVRQMSEPVFALV